MLTGDGRHLFIMNQIRASHAVIAMLVVSSSCVHTEQSYVFFPSWIMGLAQVGLMACETCTSEKECAQKL